MNTNRDYYRDKSILVTGGGGFIGSWLVEELAKVPPRNLVVVDNSFAGKRENLLDAKMLMPSLKVFAEDATDYGMMRDIISGEEVNIVFSLATVALPVSLKNPYWASQTIYSLALCLCQLMKELKTPRLVHVSTSEVYGNARYLPMDEAHPLKGTTPYAAAKGGADLLIQAYQQTFGIDAMIIRPFNTYGPRQANGGLIPSVLKCMMNKLPPIISGDGEQTRDWTYVVDVVKGILIAASCGELQGRAVNVGSGIETSVNELIAMLACIVGTKEKPIIVPPRPADVRKHCANILLLRQATGFVLSVSIEEGLKKTFEWYQPRMK